jgi:hypothetical protein
MCLHEFFFIQAGSPSRHLGPAGPDGGRGRHGLLRVGRYFRTREGSEARGLLLRLCSLKDLRGLQQNVRVAEVCFAVVGGDVREAPSEPSRRESRRGATVAQTLACRAGIEVVSPE